MGQIYVHFDYLSLLVKGFQTGLSITRFRITTFCSRKIVLCSSKNWILYMSSFLQLRKCCLSISGTTASPSKSKKRVSAQQSKKPSWDEGKHQIWKVQITYQSFAWSFLSDTISPECATCKQASDERVANNTLFLLVEYITTLRVGIPRNATGENRPMCQEFVFQAFWPYWPALIITPGITPLTSGSDLSS